MHKNQQQKMYVILENKYKNLTMLQNVPFFSVVTCSIPRMEVHKVSAFWLVFSHIFFFGFLSVRPPPRRHKMELLPRKQSKVLIIFCAISSFQTKISCR